MVSVAKRRLSCLDEVGLLPHADAPAGGLPPLPKRLNEQQLYEMQYSWGCRSGSSWGVNDRIHDRVTQGRGGITLFQPHSG